MNNMFNQHWKRYDEWYERNRYTYLSELKLIKKMLPQKGKGLEIGVGTGRFAGPLGIMHGIEPSVNMAKLARDRGIDVTVGVGESLPFCGGSFDYAAIIIALCFVDNPEQVLQEARRVLKKDGILLIGFIDKDSFLGKQYQTKNSIFYRGAHLFSVNEVALLIKKAKFNRLVYWQTLFTLPEEICEVQKPIKGFGKGGFVLVRCKCKK